MASYKIAYGDDQNLVHETYHDIDDLQREDGWLTLFRGNEAIIRVQEAHVQSLEILKE
jgi:hypothetical protein